MESHKEIKSILKELSQMKKQSLFLIIIAMILTISACTEKEYKYLADEKAGIEYYQNGSYDKALASLKKAYGSGSMEASLFILQKCHRQGNGVEKIESFLAITIKNQQKGETGKPF